MNWRLQSELQYVFIDVSCWFSLERFLSFICSHYFLEVVFIGDLCLILISENPKHYEDFSFSPVFIPRKNLCCLELLSSPTLVVVPPSKRGFVNKPCRFCSETISGTMGTVLELFIRLIQIFPEAFFCSRNPSKMLKLILFYIYEKNLWTFPDPSHSSFVLEAGTDFIS